jgi:hypothetical protein
MEQLLRESAPHIAWVTGYLALLLLAPLGRRGERSIIALFLLLGAAALGWLAYQQGSEPRSLEVFNVFLRGEERHEHRWAIETVTRPSWQWAALLAGAFALPGLVILARAGREPSVPHPALYGAFIGIWVLALRLGLEKLAAPQPVVWAMGLLPACLALGLFAGVYAGLRRMSFAGFLLSLLAMHLLQRAVLAGIAFLATTRGLGTHLDVRAVTEVNPPLFGPRTFGDDPVEKWMHAVAVMQGFWVVVGLVVTSVVGLLPWAFAAARARQVRDL